MPFQPIEVVSQSLTTKKSLQVSTSESLAQAYNATLDLSSQLPKPVNGRLKPTVVIRRVVWCTQAVTDQQCHPF
jgi:hypothetical protein